MIIFVYIILIVGVTVGNTIAAGICKDEWENSGKDWAPFMALVLLIPPIGLICVLVMVFILIFKDIRESMEDYFD